MEYDAIAAKDLATKLITALYAQGLLNRQTYQNVLTKYA